MASLGQMFQIGCGDNSCVWGSRGGMATNGGCRCYGQRNHRRPFNEEAVRARLELMGGIRLLRELVDLPKIEASLKELVRIITENEETTE